MGFDFIVIVPLLPFHSGFSFVFGCGVSFLVSSSVFLSMILQQLVVILVLSQEGVSTRPSTPPSWTNLLGPYLFYIAIFFPFTSKASSYSLPPPYHDYFMKIKTAPPLISNPYPFLLISRPLSRQNQGFRNCISKYTLGMNLSGPRKNFKHSIFIIANNRWEYKA